MRVYFYDLRDCEWRLLLGEREQQASVQLFDGVAQSDGEGCEGGGTILLAKTRKKLKSRI